MKNKTIIPRYATHPGELIKDEIRERHMTQKELAGLMGVQQSVLSETINGKRAVSVNMAVALEKALAIPADYWLNLQSQYDLDTNAIAERNDSKQLVKLYIPLKDRNLLQEVAHKFGWACIF